MRRKLSLTLAVLPLATVSLSPACVFAAEQHKAALPAHATQPVHSRQVALQFAQLMAQGKGTQAVKFMDATMTNAVPAAKLDAIWQTLVVQNGVFKKFGPSRSESLGPYETVFVPAEFARLTVDLKIVLDRQNKVAGLFVVPHSLGYARPDYVKTAEFFEQKTSIASGALTLDALWTIPKGNPPFPAVILVHGSGPHDKDESVGSNKPFKDLAEGLASNGVAVLRYEKRTKQHPTKMDLNNITVQEETVEDAAAAVKVATSAPHIDASRVFVLGHSLGGYLIPRIGKIAPAAAGYIVLAGSARPMEDLLVEQTAYIMKASPGNKAQNQSALDDLKAKVAKVKAADLSPSTASALLPMGIPARYWLDLRGYEPVSELKALDKPALILQGGRDYQVTPAGDFRRWRDELYANSKYTLKLYPRMNHLFAEGNGMATPEEYLNKAANVSPEVILDIADWVKRTGNPAPETK